MATARNASTHPQDLDDGRVIAPGEVVTGVDLDQPHNAAAIAAGVLTPEDDAPRGRRRSAPPKED